MGTGVENLLGYKGSSGLGSNPNIPAVASNPNLDTINKMGEDAMLLSAQRNLHIFNQKISDRDAMIEMLHKGQLTAGEILPEDRKHYDAAEKKQIDAFHAIKDRNDLGAIEDYEKSSRELSDLVVHAQSRVLQDKINKVEVSKEQNPFLRKRKQEEYDDQRKNDFWQMINPLGAVFQFSKDYNNDLSEGSIVGLGTPSQPTDNVIKQTGATTAPGAVGMGVSNGRNQTTQRTTTKTTSGKPSTITQTQTTSPEKPIKGIEPVDGQIVKGADGKTYEISGNRIDFNKILDNANSMIYNPEQEPYWHNLEHLNILEKGMPIFQSKPVLDTYVKRAQEYMAVTGDVNNNTLKNLTGVVNVDKGEQVLPGTRPIAIIHDGQLKMNISSSELAAIDRLSKIPAYASFSKKWREDMDKFNLATQTEDEKARHNKAMEGANWAKVNAMMKLNDAKISALQPEDVAPFFKNQWISNFTGQKSPIPSTINANESMPIFSFKNGKMDLLPPIGGTPIYANKDDKYKPLNSNSKPIGYEGGTYEKVLFDNTGKRVNMEDVTDSYGDYKRKALAQGSKNSDIYSLNDYINNAIKKGGLSYAMKGANQMITQDEYIAGQQALSNLYTKQKQQGIFNGIINDNSEVTLPDGSE